ncbi:MAG: FUSC family protein [Candidatus Nanopelagicaceae bacterium]
MERNWYRETLNAIKVRRYWLRQVLIAGIASAVAWHFGNLLVNNGGLVAAIACALSIRISTYKSFREGFGQIVGTAIGASIALAAVGIFNFGNIAIFVTIVMCSIVARALRLGEVASVNVPVTALIVIGPGISENTALTRLGATFVGAIIAVIFSYWAHPKTPTGRTIELIATYTKRCANLLSEMSEGVASTFDVNVAGKWLSKGRNLVDTIPNLRSQALEAKKSSRWLPNDNITIAEVLYLRAVSTEHLIVQVRSISRSLFDLAVDGGVPERVRRELALALSAASYAVADKAVSSNLVETANDLRDSSAVLRDALIKQTNVISSEIIVKLVSIVSNLDVIADSLDESSPAITDVLTPDEPSGHKIIETSWIRRLIKRLLPK